MDIFRTTVLFCSLTIWNIYKTESITMLTIFPNDDPASLIEYESSQFTCYSDFGVPSPSIQWYKDNGTQDITDDIDVTSLSSVETCQHITVSTLTITPSVSDNNMRVYCTWNNGGQTVTSEQKPLLRITAGCFVVSTDYQGLVNLTESGRTCQMWSLDTPHQHRNRVGRIFAGNQSAIDAKNYCRDPKGEEGRPWCYTNDPGRRWELCNVPKCTVPITTLTLFPKDDPVSLIANQASLFTCTSDFGLPAPSINWYLDYGTPHDIKDDLNLTCASSITTSRKHITTSSLTVMPSIYEHNMRLYCTGNNGGRLVTSNVKPWIKVLHTNPSVTSRPVLQNATLSGDIKQSATVSPLFPTGVLTGGIVGCIAFGFGAGMFVMWWIMHQRMNANITRSSGSNNGDMQLQFETNVNQTDDTYMTVEDDRIETYLNPIA